MCTLFVSVAYAQFQFTVDSFTVSGPNPLDEATTQRVLSPYVGEQDGLSTLEEAREALASELRKRGYMFHRVYLPQQKLGGDVEFIIAVFDIEELSVEGQEHFSQENILRSLPMLTVGEAPNTRDLSRNIETVNKNPAKQIELTFAAGETLDRMKSKINVHDSKPARFFAWLNNTGNETSGEERLGVGYQNANLFDRDHVLTFTYATSPEFIEDVIQFGGFYQIPFYNHGGMLNLLAAYSDTDSGIVAGVLNVRGKGIVLGASYTYLFPRKGNFRHWVDLGFVDKLFDNDIDFEDQPIGVDVRSTPASLRYFGEWKSLDSDAGFYAGFAANTGVGSQNDQLSYTLTRLGADVDWNALHFGGTYNRGIGNFSVRLLADAQYGGEPLIPGEQFGLGGVTNRVRGFEEREVAGDNGVRANVELWLPVHRPTRTSSLLFVDAGYVELENSQPGENASDELASVGVGFRWLWFNRLNASMDAGYIVNGINDVIPNASREGDYKVHFTLAAQF